MPGIALEGDSMFETGLGDLSLSLDLEGSEIDPGAIPLALGMADIPSFELLARRWVLFL